VQPAYVIHLAGISFVPHGDAAEVYGINTLGTSHLLECIHQVVPGVRKVILASSANIYGNATQEPITEDTPPCPVNHYGCSKLSMEFIARTWFDRLPVVITRPFNYTGRGQAPHFLVPKLVSHFVRRAPAIELGNLDVVRDFSDVRMVCDAYTRLLQAPVRSAVLNVCSGIGRSLRSVVKQLEEICGHAPQINVDPALVRAVEVHRLVGSNDALKQAIGPLSYLDFSATLDWMCEQEKA
jgi:GDP-6-deoxy-D-talose 4-dehydrogenase